MSKTKTLLSSEEHYHLMEQQVNHGCLFLVIFLGLIYLVFVAFFWMIGSITHSSTKSLTGLHEAQSAEEIRDELANRFGRFDFSRAATKAQDAAAEKATAIKNQAIDAATEAAANAAGQATDEATQAISDQIDQAVDQNQP